MTANPRSILRTDPDAQIRQRKSGTTPLRSSHAVVLSVPFDKSGKSGLNRYPRLKTEIAAGRFYIRVTCWHVAELHRQQPLCCRPAKQPLEHTDKIKQLLRA